MWSRTFRFCLPWWLFGVCGLTLGSLWGCGEVDSVGATPGQGGSSQGPAGSPPASTAGSGGGSPNDARPDTALVEDDAATGEDRPDVVVDNDEPAAIDATHDAVAPVDAARGEEPPANVSHRVLSSVSDRGILALLTKEGQIEWQYDVLTLGGEANDAWLLPNGNVVFAYKQGAREITAAKQLVWDYPAPAGSEVHSCQPLADGNYLVGEAHDAGVGLLREVNRTGKVVSTVTLNVPGGISAHGQFREVRKTVQGTYLVTYLQLDRAMEFDGAGKLLREFPCGSFVAIRLPDGNTLIACGDAHRVIEVDRDNKVVWEVTEQEIAGNRLGFAAGLQRLSNGNTVICNWPGHFAADPHQPQAFELTRDKKVVWTLNDPRLGWTSNVEVVDPEASVGGAILR
jgi:hypothetical protein